MGLGKRIVDVDWSLFAKRYRRQIENPRLFLGAIVFSILFLFAWASFAKIDRVVRVEGRIIPAGRSQQIQHLEGGIVAAISTSEGATVKKGDLLLTITDTAAGANLGESEAKLVNQRARKARLESEMKDLDHIDFPPDIANAPAADAERNLFEARKAKLAQDLLVHENTISQHKAELDEVTRRYTRLQGELATAHKRSEMEISMAAHNAASKLEVLDAQSREQRLETELGDAENSIPALKAGISEEEARIASARAGFRAEAQTELVSVLAEIDQVKQLVTAEADRVNRTEIRAPVDGIINRIGVNTVGGVIKPGENLIELIPITNEVLVETKSLPKDRGYLRPGLRAKIRVSAYDIGELGLLDGKVTEVSADTMQDPRGESYYRVKILVNDIPTNYIGKPMVPGMTASADIVTGRRTVLSYLLSPLTKFTYSIFRDSR
jgi:adhesin transport system membrane fusion protein